MYADETDNSYYQVHMTLVTLKGYWVKGQGQPAAVVVEILWTGELLNHVRDFNLNLHKHFLQSSHELIRCQKSWFKGQGHGFKSQVHSNVYRQKHVDRRRFPSSF